MLGVPHRLAAVLNNFGIQFKDNGYQLGNDKDSPIYQNNAYFPITFRVTPQWHLENTNKVLIDQTGTEQSVTTHGFDLSGLDIWTAGTLSKNISFQVLPSMEEGDGFHFEVRLGAIRQSAELALAEREGRQV